MFSVSIPPLRRHLLWLDLIAFPSPFDSHLAVFVASKTVCCVGIGLLVLSIYKYIYNIYIGMYIYIYIIIYVYIYI